MLAHNELRFEVSKSKSFLLLGGPISAEAKCVSQQQSIHGKPTPEPGR